MSLEYGIQNHVAMAWLPDGHTVSFAGNETGQGWRIYLQDIGGGEPRPITPGSSYREGWGSGHRDNSILGLWAPGFCRGDEKVYSAAVTLSGTLPPLP